MKNKFLIRVVSLWLVPCLMAEPSLLTGQAGASALAAVFPGPFAPCVKSLADARGTHRTPFQEQALAAVARFSGRQITAFVSRGLHTLFYTTLPPKKKEPLAELERSSYLAFQVAGASQPRQPDGRYDKKPGGDWSAVLETILSNLDLLELANSGELTIEKYRRVDRRVSETITRRDFASLVNQGYLSLNASTRTHTFRLTSKAGKPLAKRYITTVRRLCDELQTQLREGPGRKGPALFFHHLIEVARLLKTIAWNLDYLTWQLGPKAQDALWFHHRLSEAGALEGILVGTKVAIASTRNHKQRAALIREETKSALDQILLLLDTLQRVEKAWRQQETPTSTIRRSGGRAELHLAIYLGIGIAAALLAPSFLPVIGSLLHSRSVWLIASGLAVLLPWWEQLPGASWIGKALQAIGWRQEERWLPAAQAMQKLSEWEDQLLAVKQALDHQKAKRKEDKQIFDLQAFLYAQRLKDRLANALSRMLDHPSVRVQRRAARLIRDFMLREFASEPRRMTHLLNTIDAVRERYHQLQEALQQLPVSQRGSDRASLEASIEINRAVMLIRLYAQLAQQIDNDEPHNYWQLAYEVRSWKDVSYHGVSVEMSDAIREIFDQRRRAHRELHKEMVFILHGEDPASWEPGAPLYNYNTSSAGGPGQTPPGGGSPSGGRPGTAKKEPPPSRFHHAVERWRTAWDGFGFERVRGIKDWDGERRRMPKVPEQPLTILVSIWSEAYAARTLVEAVRRMGSSRPIRIHAVPSFPDRGAESPRLRALFADVPNLQIIRLPFDFEKKNGIRVFFVGGDPIKSVPSPYPTITVPYEPIKAWPGPVSEAEKEQLRSDLQLGSEPVVVVGNANLEETTRILPIFSRLRARLSTASLRLILVPRITGQSGLWQAAVARAGLPVSLRQPGHSGTFQLLGHPKAPVIVVNTNGELRTAYALGPIGIIGHTFNAGFSGHNPMEPVVQGSSALFGSGIEFNRQLARLVLSSGAGIQLDSLRELEPALFHILSHPDAAAGYRRGAQLATQRLREELIPQTLGPFFEKLRELDFEQVRRGSGQNPSAAPSGRTSAAKKPEDANSIGLRGLVPFYLGLLVLLGATHAIAWPLAGLYGLGYLATAIGLHELVLHGIFTEPPARAWKTLFFKAIRLRAPPPAEGEARQGRPAHPTAWKWLLAPIVTFAASLVLYFLVSHPVTLFDLVSNIGAFKIFLANPGTWLSVASLIDLLWFLPGTDAYRARHQKLPELSPEDLRSRITEALDALDGIGGDTEFYDRVARLLRLSGPGADIGAEYNDGPSRGLVKAGVKPVTMVDIQDITPTKVAKGIQRRTGDAKEKLPFKPNSLGVIVYNESFHCILPSGLLDNFPLGLLQGPEHFLEDLKKLRMIINEQLPSALFKTLQQAYAALKPGEIMLILTSHYELTSTAEELHVALAGRSFEEVLAQRGFVEIQEFRGTRAHHVFYVAKKPKKIRANLRERLIGYWHRLLPATPPGTEPTGGIRRSKKNLALQSA